MHNEVRLLFLILAMFIENSSQKTRARVIAQDEQWDFDYCGITCNGTEHTMCEYPAGGGAECHNNLKVYLTKDEKVYIQDQLNRLRERVAKGEHPRLPMTSNMQKLVWDRELSTIAKRWADQCLEGLHDACRLTSDEIDTGQIVRIGRFKDHAKTAEARNQRIKEEVGHWLDEETLFDPDLIPCYDPVKGEGCTNFSQIIWATTEFIGCGYTEFQMTDYVMSRFVCNLQRKGNIEGSKVYRKGKPCSACPSRTNCSDSYVGLCWNHEFGNYRDLEEVDGGNRLTSTVVTLVVTVVASAITVLRM